jgi:hypothetical protein
MLNLNDKREVKKYCFAEAISFARPKEIAERKGRRRQGSSTRLCASENDPSKVSGSSRRPTGRAFPFTPRGARVPAPYNLYYILSWRGSAGHGGVEEGVAWPAARFLCPFFVA